MRRALGRAASGLPRLSEHMRLLHCAEAYRQLHSSRAAEQELRGAAAAAAERLARMQADPLLFHAQMREISGRVSSAKLRQTGRTPAVVFNQFDKDKLLISLDANELLRKLVAFRKSGFMTRVFTVQLPGRTPDGSPERIPVLPKQVYVDAVTNQVENVAFLRCPPDTRVRVDVALDLIGADTAPGLRKGGTINLMRRKVRLWCAGNSIPTSIPLDISTLDVGQKIVHSQLPLPPGVALVLQDPSLPVVKIMGRARGRRAEEEKAEEGAAAAADTAKPASKTAAAPAAGGAGTKPAASK